MALLAIMWSGTALAQAGPDPTAANPPGHAAAAAPEPLPETAEAFGVVLRDWVARHQLGQAVVVVRRRGKVVYALGIGGDTERPLLLASLSKAITAACIATLVRDGKLTLQTPLKVALAEHFARTGPPADERLLATTIAQLLTHRSGLAGNGGDGEAASGAGRARVIQDHGPGVDSAKPLLLMALSQGLKREPGQYRYSNDGYLTLGAVIEEATQLGYEAACRQRVLEPAGAKGALAADWGLLGPQAGWSMTGADYLATLEAITGSDRLIGAAAAAWQASGAGQTPASDASWYGLGLYTRRTGDAYSHWHWGEMNIAYQRAGGPWIKVGSSTFAMTIGEEATSWFVAFEPNLPAASIAKLDPEMRRAFAAVTRW